MAPVANHTADALMRAIDHKLSRNIDRLHVMLSTPGGSVFHGLSIHNLLRGAPIPVTTYNFGSVDSIGVVIFCAGQERICVPHARFLVHNVSFGLQNGVMLDDKQLAEKLKLLHSDQGNIAKVIADASGKKQKEVLKIMDQRTTLSPEKAKDIGLVTDIRSQLFNEGAEMTMIYENGTIQELTLAPKQLPLDAAQAHPAFPQQVFQPPMQPIQPIPAALESFSPNVPSACSVPVETGTYFPWMFESKV